MGKPTVPNWIYTNPNVMGPCDVYKTVFFENFGHIHSFCRECYKIAVRPTSKRELVDLLVLMRRLNYPAKAGIETRKTVDGLYGGYFYCRGLEQGRERFEEIRTYVPKHVPMILKRYCTEFEIRDGVHFPSNETPEATQVDIDWEQHIMEPYGRTKPYANKFYQEHQIVGSWVDYPKVVTYQGGNEKANNRVG